MSWQTIVVFLVGVVLGVVGLAWVLADEVDARSELANRISHGGHHDRLQAQLERTQARVAAADLLQSCPLPSRSSCL